MITLIVPTLKRGITEMRPSVVTAILSSQRIFFSWMRVRQENSPCLLYCTGTVMCTRFLHVKECSLVSNTSRYDFSTYPVKCNCSEIVWSMKIKLDQIVTVLVEYMYTVQRKYVKYTKYSSDVCRFPEYLFYKTAMNRPLVSYTSSLWYPSLSKSLRITITLPLSLIDSLHR